MKSYKRVCALLLPILVLSFLSNQFLRAQDPAEQRRLGRSSIDALRDSLAIVNEDIRLLQHILEASTIDPRMLQNSKVKSWVIANPELRDSLFYALMAIDSSLEAEAGAEAEVLATPTDDILEVRFGTSVFKGARLRDAIAKSGDKRLYQRVGESHKYSKDVELRDPGFRIPTSFNPELTPYDKLLDEFTPVVMHSNPHPERAKADVSLYGAIFKIGPTWGGEIRIGNDEIGYPFWSSGKTAFLATYKQIKFGFELPFTPGRSSSDLIPPFTLRGRKLNGTRGIVGEFDFGPAGGFVSITRFTEHDTKALTDPNDFAFISTIVQGYFSFGVALNPTNLVRVKAGGGFHRVREGRILKIPVGGSATQFEEFIDLFKQTQYGSPYLKFEYVNKDLPEKFGASFQFYDYVLLSGAWIEIVPGTVRLEMKYAWKVLRDFRKWETTDFFIISPRVRFSL